MPEVNNFLKQTQPPHSSTGGAGDKLFSSPAEAMAHLHSASALPPCAGDCSQALPEFCRVPDVQRLFGIRRGKLYQLIKSGIVKSISLRDPGKKFGCRLIWLQSVRDWLHRELETQNPPAASTTTVSQPASNSNLPDNLQKAVVNNNMERK